MMSDLTHYFTLGMRQSTKEIIKPIINAAVAENADISLKSLACAQEFILSNPLDVTEISYTKGGLKTILVKAYVPDREDVLTFYFGYYGGVYMRDGAKKTNTYDDTSSGALEQILIRYDATKSE